MKLYTYDPAPNPQRLGMFMDYQGIDIETVQVDMMTQEHLGEAYLEVNPLGTVPALVLDDGTTLTEVIGCCNYLESLYPEKPLMGSTDLERAQVISWDHLLFVSVFMAVAEIFRNGNPNFTGRALPGALGIEQIPALVERGQRRLEAGWRTVDKRLGEADFLAGDNFSLADIDLMILAEFAGWAAKSPVPEDCANILDWMPRAKAAFEGS